MKFSASLLGSAGVVAATTDQALRPTNPSTESGGLQPLFGAHDPRSIGRVVLFDGSAEKEWELVDGKVRSDRKLQVQALVHSFGFQY